MPYHHHPASLVAKVRHIDGDLVVESMISPTGGNEGQRRQIFEAQWRYGLKDYGDLGPDFPTVRAGGRERILVYGNTAPSLLARREPGSDVTTYVITWVIDDYGLRRAVAGPGNQQRRSRPHQQGRAGHARRSTRMPSGAPGSNTPRWGRI